jgi:hypothetical protein
MSLIGDQQTYFVEVPQVITYDVGRDGIGLVSLTLEAGEVIVGQERDGKIRYNAIHVANGKSYFTPVFLDPEMLKKTTYVPTAPRRITKQEASIMVLVFLGLTFGLLVSKK